MASKPKTAGKAPAPKKVAAKKAPVVEPKLVDKTLTQEDLDLQPELVAEGYKVGDVVQVEDENADDTGVAQAAKVNKVAAPSKTATEVDIIKSGIEYVRTYSEDVHGEDFMELADQYCEGHTDSAKADSDKIKIVIVNYRVTDKKSGVTTDTQKSYSGSMGEDFKAQALAFKNEVNGTVTISKA